VKLELLDPRGFLERNHEVTEEEEVKQSKVAWTEPPSNPGSKLGYVWIRLAQAPKRFLERNHEVTEEEEVKQSKVAWTEPQSNPGSKLGYVWTRLAQAPKCDPIKDVPRLPTLILSHI
ncbi:hypothetical protein PIB30_088325, partial [Stylosanthes scabra]|nr:hypothetical protein [Stylosanthes scabra]